MTICSKTLEAVRERLEERKSLEEIGRELCDAVDDHKGKALRLVRKLYGENKEEADRFLKENADWLGYRIDKAKGDKAKGGFAKSEKMSVQKNVHSNPIVPISTISIASVAPEVIVSDKVVKDTKKEIDTIPVVDLHVDPTIPISSIPAMAIVPGTIISDTSSTEVKESKETIDQPIKETVGWVENKYKDTKSVLPLPITDQPSPPTPLPTSCIVGKQIPDCNICELGFSDNEKWHCDDFNLLCSAKSCLVGKYIEDKRTCSSCNFKTHLKKVFWYHVKLVHKDNEGLMNQVREEIKQYIIQHKLSAIVICPGCGYGFDTGKQVFLTKKELDNIRSFQSAPPEIRETVNNINLKLI